VATVPDHSADIDRDGGRREPGAARLYALVAGALLALLGVLGFFYDAGFSTGTDLSADDVAGIIVVNGWRNVLYLLTGLLALGFAARRPRPTAAAVGGVAGTALVLIEVRRRRRGEGIRSIVGDLRRATNL
jgi:hypothetical protein